MICKLCKQDKDPAAFKAGYRLVCNACTADPRPGRRMVVSKYEKMIERRNDANAKALQDKLWEKLELAFSAEAGTDVEPFTDSEEMDSLMERYQKALILKISGIEDIPEWMNPEEE